MRIEDFVAKYPQLFHMAKAETWDQIQRHGLRSTTALLDLFRVAGAARFEIESMRRPEIVPIEHPEYGRAEIRDNKPLREQFLSECLDGMSTQEWYELLNRKVFFWVRPERLETLLKARAYRNRPHDVLTLDTARLLERHRPQVTLASINTGATLYPSAPRRGRNTFAPVEEFDFETARRRRGVEAVVELTVDYAVPDVRGLVIKVERRQDGQPTRVLWKP